MLRKTKNLSILCFILIVTLSIFNYANASTVLFPLDYEISGGSAPAGSTPWVTATFVDVSPNNVQLTMSATNLTGTEFITGWYFNSSIATSGLTFTVVDITDINTPTIDLGSDSFKADGDGYFDIRFNFETSNDPMTGRFQAGESVIYNISASSLSASSFNLMSASGGGAGLYHSVAKVQGINGNDGTSGWIANTSVVPEPVSSTLFIIGAATLGFRRFRNFRKG